MQFRLIVSGSCIVTSSYASNGEEVKIIDTKKIDRFILLLEKLVKELLLHRNLTVHREISESFYRQKIEEMKLLSAQLNDVLHDPEQVRSRIHEIYENVYCRWRKDARWLCSYLRKTSIL